MIKDTRVLYDIARSGADKKIVKKAIISLQEDQELLYQYICSCNDSELCVFAVKELKDEEKLYDIACGGYAYPVREQVLLQLNDQNKIRAILQNETDPRLRSIACGMTRKGIVFPGVRARGVVPSSLMRTMIGNVQNINPTMAQAKQSMYAKCGLKKHEDWNPYNASERYSHSSRPFV